MSKKNKTTLLDVIKDFIQIIFSRVNSTPGKVNIGFGFFIVLVIFIVLFQPIVFYILQMIQSICNAILSYYEKELIPISESGDTILALSICLIFLFIESILCSLLVHWSESNKKALK